MEASTITLIACGIMDEDDDELGSPSSSSSGDSSSSEFMDDATSSPSTSSSSTPSLVQHQKGTALFEMSSLMAQLPFKRGLSKHFEGKSQSFASLSSVRCLEDLAKPERPNHKRRLKPCKSYGGGLDAHTHRPCCCSRAISKKPSRGARQGFLGGAGGGGSRPPVPPHRSGGFSARTLLFA